MILCKILVGISPNLLQKCSWKQRLTDFEVKRLAVKVAVRPEMVRRPPREFWRSQLKVQDHRQPFLCFFVKDRLVCVVSWVAVSFARSTSQAIGWKDRVFAPVKFLAGKTIFKMIDWLRLNVPPTQYRSYGDGFLRVKWPNQQCQSTEGTLNQIEQSTTIHLN